MREAFTGLLNEKTKRKHRPNAVDVYVGQKVRQRRIALNMSQKQLAEKMGITFQQIQKYELGANRISASRLWDICHLLNVDADYFFEGMDDSIKQQSPMMVKQEVQFDSVSETFKIDDPMLKKETTDLLKAINCIGNKQVTQMLLKLMEDMSGCR